MFHYIEPLCFFVANLYVRKGMPSKYEMTCNFEHLFDVQPSLLSHPFPTLRVNFLMNIFSNAFNLRHPPPTNLSSFHITFHLILLSNYLSPSQSSQFLNKFLLSPRHPALATHPQHSLLVTLPSSPSPHHLSSTHAHTMFSKVLALHFLPVSPT